MKKWQQLYLFYKATQPFFCFLKKLYLSNFAALSFNPALLPSHRSSIFITTFSFLAASNKGRYPRHRSG
ncbi:MAG: hypothetical protein LBI81_00065 [Puniceicoccales bacterium]|jgi:hypothetical protein|nr:hypothetical protein [Puniceicoccales bacterium]